MKLKFDHVIHYVEDANAIMNHLSEKYHMHVVPGGRHEKRGTYNTLLHFGLNYIEFLAIDDFGVFETSKATEIKFCPFSTISEEGFKEGFARVCLRTKNLEALGETLRKKGLEVNGPVPLSRRQPDGNLLEWSLLYANDPESELPLPFFIDWQVSDEEREAELRKLGVIRESSKEFDISYLAFAVRDVKRTVSKWSEWFELKVVKEFVDMEMNARVAVLGLEGGQLAMAEPLGEGIVSSVLQSRGEGPFMLALEGERDIGIVTINGAMYKSVSSR